MHCIRARVAVFAHARSCLFCFLSQYFVDYSLVSGPAYLAGLSYSLDPILVPFISHSFGLSTVQLFLCTPYSSVIVGNTFFTFFYFFYKKVIKSYKKLKKVEKNNSKNLTFFTFLQKSKKSKKKVKKVQKSTKKYFQQLLMLYLRVVCRSMGKHETSVCETPHTPAE
jgi:hypothetical protein